MEKIFSTSCHFDGVSHEAQVWKNSIHRSGFRLDTPTYHLKLLENGVQVEDPLEPLNPWTSHVPALMRAKIHICVLTDEHSMKLRGLIL